MASIHIRNIGPIKEVDIELNKINIFIGPQSIGKSTLAKLISFCNWLEKDCILLQDTLHVDTQYIEDHLIKYHNLSGYFCKSSYFKYESEVLTLSIKDGEVWMKQNKEFETTGLSKNAYIPSERNVLGLPNIFSLKLPDNYLLEFIDDWLEIRTKYKAESSLVILKVGVKYYFNESENRDKIRLKDGYVIGFDQASSGLQSVIPLCVCVDYLTQWIYNNEENHSADKRKLYRELIDRKIRQSLKETGIVKGNKALPHLTPLTQEEIIQHLKYHIEAFYHPSSTNLVIEEPEQNLFPETQVQLIYYILSKIEHANRRDNLIITTHSPYILYAINNCLLASIASAIDKEVVREISTVPERAWVDPEIVSVWELKDGTIRDGKTIQDDRGLIRSNYFERVMHNVMADFSNLLSIL